jgi:serine/threonine-protein kinase
MSTSDLPGSSLLAGRYRLVERLGAGGMSVVWRGFDEVLGRQVAVKVLPPSTSADPSFRRRLRAEAQAAARLSHPNITNVYDYGEATTADGEPVPYVVMELIDGESLAAVLARVRRLPWQHAARITADVAAALAAAHSRGIVHRDVTPANVMLTQTGAKVVDFGISALIGENDIDPDGSLLGTPAYLAPERLEGGQVSPATDVYAVGLLIYRTLIGQLPWDVGTTTALLRAHQYIEPDPLPQVDGLPPAISALVGRCLEKRPADRPSSAELAHVLAGISAGAPQVARGYVPDWSDSGEDTHILPGPQSYPDLPAVGPLSAAPPVSPGAPPLSPAASGSGAPGSGAFASAAPGSGDPGSGASGPGASTPGSPVSPAGPPARNSGFAALKSGPVVPPPSSALRPAIGGQPPPPSGPPSRNEGPGASRPGGRGMNSKTRRIVFVAGAVLLLALGTYGWSLTSETGNDTPANAAAPQPSVVPPTGRCVVSYAVWSDDGGKFKAEVTLANRADAPVKDWTLWFIMPGDQVVSGNGKVDLKQDSTQVTVSSTTALNPQKAVTLPLTGRYTASNAAPLAFSLNRQTCETFVSAKPGEPSRQVEHLSDGTTRLGALPSSDDPLPGISVGPDGVVDIKPTSAGPSTPPPPGGGPSTSPTTKLPPPPEPSIDEPSSDPPTSEPTTNPPPATTPPDVDCDVEGDPTCAGDGGTGSQPGDGAEENTDQDGRAVVPPPG